MSMFRRFNVAGVTVVLLLCSGGRTVFADEAPAKPPMVEQYVNSGRLAEGELALRAHLKHNPRDDEARFGLGTLQFVRSVERLAQSLHHYGLRHRIQVVPFLRMPVGPNASPEPINYEEFRLIFQTFSVDLMRVESTLAEIRDPKVKLRLHFAQIRMDVNGDGTAQPEESLWKMYARLNRRAGVTEETAQKLVIAFDKGDVHWLRGYCHLLAAFCDTILAYDMKELFESTGHVFFPEIESPHAHLRWQTDERRDWTFEIADAVAAIHLCRFEVREPHRLKSAHTHLIAVVDQSRLSWKAIQAEADDEFEWVPNARQTGVIPGVRVTQEMIDGWHEFLDEFAAILNGEKLLPHWRVMDGRGINLKRVFAEPRTFDLVLWAQGSAATPYLEKGELTQPETWMRLNRVFRGEFIGFAIWFN
jgi:hypothetical protein